MMVVCLNRLSCNVCEQTLVIVCVTANCLLNYVHLRKQYCSRFVYTAVCMSIACQYKLDTMYMFGGRRELQAVYFMSNSWIANNNV